MADDLAASIDDAYVRGLHDAIARRAAELAALQDALHLYKERCAAEDLARQQIKRPVGLPWAG